MKLRIRDYREFLAGLVFLAIGVGWGCSSIFYPVGRATNMGPGYFPLVVSILLAFLGLCSLVRSIRAIEFERLPPWALGPLIFVGAGIAFFAFFIERAGLVVATIGLVVIASYKRVLTRPVETIVLALVTTAFVAGLFIYVLQLNLSLF